MKKLSYQEYLAFLLLYAAYADQSLDREEILKILDLVKKDDFVRMKELILSMNDQKRIDLALEYRNIYLQNREQIDQALLDIEVVFLADHDFLPIEKFYFSFLNKFFHRS